jgi:hypothetical protein
MMPDTIAAAVFIVVAAMAWQHLRYQHIRRDSAQDRQKAWHLSEAFHVMVFFKLRNGDKVVDTVRRFAQQILANSKASLIYAGEAAFTVSSKQLGNCDWNGVLLFEYPSRTEYQESLAAGHWHEARQYFADSYLHGMRRDRHRNLAVPQFLLRLRLKDILCGRWRVEPLEVSPIFATFPEYAIWRTREARLRAFNAINSQGLVVYSLVKRGKPEQWTDNTVFAGKMASRMAALGHGPLHIGHPIALENLARFDQVFATHYPSADYFANLLASQFFHNLTSSRQLADYFAVFTIPITERL